MVSAGVGAVTGTLTKVLGAQVLTDVQTFVAALDTMFGGFRERADTTYRLLQAPGTAFVVVAAPERDALREASYFVERLAAERMPLAGLVLNRVHDAGPATLSAERSVAAAEQLDERGGHDLTARLLRLHAERLRIANREEALAARFRGAHPKVATVSVRAQNGDVHDLAGLREIGAFRGRAGPDRQPALGDAWLRSCSALAASSRATPGLDVGPALEQGPALALGHATPDAELDPVVQRIGQALGADDAGHADLLGPVLLSSLDEQRVRVGCAASPRLAQSGPNPSAPRAVASVRVCSDMMSLSKTIPRKTRDRCNTAPASRSPEHS